VAYRRFGFFGERAPSDVEGRVAFKSLDAVGREPWMLVK
jgi:hypothetical protein